jgi:hypothetical protein
LEGCGKEKRKELDFLSRTEAMVICVCRVNHYIAASRAPGGGQAVVREFRGGGAHQALVQEKAHA